MQAVVAFVTDKVGNRPFIGNTEGKLSKLVCIAIPPSNATKGLFRNVFSACGSHNKASEKESNHKPIKGASFPSAGNPSTSSLDKNIGLKNADAFGALSKSSRFCKLLRNEGK